jgi:hypothetical protein
LARKKRTSWKNLELASLFFSRLPPDANKADLYRLVAPLSGHKQVFFSYMTNSALVVLDTREEALQFKQTSAEALHHALGPEVQMKLVVEAAESAAVVEDEGGVVETCGSGWISDAVTCRELLQAILTAQAPVVVDFHQYKKVQKICK